MTDVAPTPWPNGWTEVVRLAGPVRALAIVDTPDRCLLAGLADGSVWTWTAEGGAIERMPPTGAAVLAVAALDDRLIAADADRMVRIGRDHERVIMEVPARAGRSGTLYPSGPPRPIARCAAIDPRGAHVVMATDDTDSPRSDHLVVFDLSSRTIIKNLNPATQSGDDCFQIDRVAYDPLGAQLAVSGLGVRYTYDGDWSSGQDRRVAVFAMPTGSVRQVRDLASTWRPSEHSPMPLAFVGDRLIVGCWVIDASVDDGRYFSSEEELPEWCGDVSQVASCARAWLVGAEGARAFALRLGAEENEDASRVVGPTKITALTAEDVGTWVYLGLEDGRVVVWDLEGVG